MISDFFQCNVASFYAHSERLVHARSLRSGSGISRYQIDRRYGLFELLDNDQKIIESDGIKGESIGTSFDNYAMPLIRYKTGDFTEYIEIFNQNSTQNSYQRIKIRLKNGRFVEETISSLKILLKDYMKTLTIKPEQQAYIFTTSLFSDIISKLNLLFGVLFIIALIRIFHSISWFLQTQSIPGFDLFLP